MNKLHDPAIVDRSMPSAAAFSPAGAGEIVDFPAAESERIPSNGHSGLYLALISVHGLIRGNHPELGRDADTGGQVQYVLDLARALAEQPNVDRVELMTRQILSTNVDHDYGEPLEKIAEQAWIVRIPFGPHRYLHKESLWPYLPQFVGGALQHFRRIGRLPDLVHAHYADAGAVGSDLSRLLGIPLVFTGHSLGRVKKKRLIEKGLTEEVIEDRYNISRRIRAEEKALEAATLIVASTRQEVSEQYSLYETRARKKTVVIPPGVDLDRFRPPARNDEFVFAHEIDRFLREPRKPMILAIQRPDERKNLTNLIRAYGESDELQKIANLVLMIGTRDDISTLGKAQRTIFKKMLYAIDRLDLYGSVAYPKTHRPEDVPEIYRLAAQRRGVFVNPALTEPFGLTLIEAAASGLPVVSTRDGGPSEIVDLCQNGVLVDPLDIDAIAAGLQSVLEDRRRWLRRSRAGIKGADDHFSWGGHVRHYLDEARKILEQHRRKPEKPGGSMVLKDSLLVCDIDNTLTGDRGALEEFSHWIEARRDRVAFGVATGRMLKSAAEAIEAWGIPQPDLLITAVGSEIYYGRAPELKDLGWQDRIDYEWDPDAVKKCLEDVPGLRLQPKRDQRTFKISYFVDTDAWPGVARLRRRLKTDRLNVSVIFSHRQFLDILPTRASKGDALRYVVDRWGFGPDRIVVAGDSGNDTQMLRASTHGIVVGNFSPELRSLRGRDGIFFAAASHAAGVLEGLDHFGMTEDE